MSRYPDEVVIAITGHRPDKLDNDYSLKSKLIKRIKYDLNDIIGEYEPDKMISGMALGIDTLWAQMAVELKIPLIAAIPFTNQPDKWPKSSQTIYYRLLDQAAEVVNVSKKVNFQPEFMQLRNQWMVDNCTLLIGVFDGTPGGTANCVTYARSIKRKRIILDPNDYR